MAAKDLDTPDAPAPGNPAKDVDSLFTRAGMVGAKYRKFPRSQHTALPEAEARPLVHAILATPAVTAEVAPRAEDIEARSAAHSWTSLEQIFAGEVPESTLSQAKHCGVTLAILSLAGGVGKTTLAVTLARILSGLQRQVLVADCGLYQSVPHHFGSRGQRLGPLHFFYPPASSAGLPIGTFRVSLKEIGKQDFQDVLEQVETSGSDLLLDLPTFQSAEVGEILACADHILVPVTPDVHSIGGLVQLQQLLAAATPETVPLHFVLNRFDGSRSLHRAIHLRLQQLLGPGLLSIVIPEDPAIEEASANGLTIVDHLPESPALKPFMALADWFRAQNRASSLSGRL